jgi:hypothetical protein
VLLATVVVFLVLFFVPVSLFAQDEYQVDLSEIEKEIEATVDKPYSLGGFLEFEPILFGLDRDSAFHRTRFFNRDQGNTLGQYDLGLRLEGSYRKGILSLFAKTDTLVRNDFEGWDEDTRLFEAFVSLKPNPSFTLDAGKKVLKWGKGYAWNPVAFVDRPKNPQDPEEALEGFTVLSADIIRSFAGPLQTAALTAAILPVYEHVNAKFGKLNHVNFAAKLYLLLFDTDIDFMVFTGASRTSRFGFDFAKNLKTNLEIHGEWALVSDFERRSINEKGERFVRESDAISYLLGLRYLTRQETTIILEYYWNGRGFSHSQMKDFYTFVDNSYETFLRTGDESGLARGLRSSKGAYGMPNPMRHYLYFRASHKEPFDILYFTPALTSIINLTDGSLVLSPELLYRPLTNLDLRLKGAVLLGREHTEYGEKQNDYRVEFRLRYHFGL